MKRLGLPDSAPRNIAALLVAMLLAAGTFAEEKPATPAEAETAPAPAPAPAERATIASDLERLAEALPEEHRVLKAGGESFDVFVRAITGGPAKGALVLIPGDGGLPPTSGGLGELRDDLPGYGWSTWLISLQRPPRVQAIAAPPPETKAPREEGTPDTPAEEGKAPPTNAEGKAPEAPTPQEADFPAPAPSLGLDARISERMQAWIAVSLPRIAAAVAEAGKEGPVTLVAEGAAAALLTGFVSEGTPGVSAVILIDPVEVQGSEARWPEAFPTPVLEVLDAETRAAIGQERRTHANAAKLARYRQLTLPGGYQSEEGQPSVLARRIRGWLLTLPAEAAKPTPVPTTKPGPEALGPQRS